MGAETVRECIMGCYGLASLSMVVVVMDILMTEVRVGVSEIQLAIIASYLLRK
jgi:hypothetical protein